MCCARICTRIMSVGTRGSCDVAAHPAVSCGAQQTLVGGCLGLLRELLGLVCRRDLRLLGLAHQLIGFVEGGRP
jgi:hypothetical protein